MLINYIPYELLGNVLTDDTVKMEKWYMSEETAQNSDFDAEERGKNEYENLKDTIRMYLHDDRYYNIWKGLGQEKISELEALL